MPIADIFNAFAQDYDKTRRQFIPCFDDFYFTVIHLIPYSASDSFTVLDLGAGTGLLSQFILASFSKAQITLLDIADKMLDRAKERFKQQTPLINYIVFDFAKQSLSELSVHFDLIVSSLAIHHLNAEEKQFLFKNIYSVLTPNGMFINADQALGETLAIEQIYRKDWFNRIRNTSLNDSEISAGLERIKADKMDPLSDQLAWLKETGFREVNCWYSNYSFCVYSGKK